MSLTVPSEYQGSISVLQDLLTLGDADPRDLTSHQTTQLRKMFEDPTVGLYLFATQIFGYKDLTPDLHLPICTFLGRWGQSVLEDGRIITTPPTESDGKVVDSYRRLMVRIPRECFKTSLCTRANALWTICKNPNATLAIFNEKIENSERWIGAISRVVENSKLFQTIWRDIIPKGIGYWDREAGIPRARSHKWGDTGLLFERSDYGIAELSIEPHGIGAATTGKHFTHMILDDIIGKNAAYSAAVMQEAIDWVDNQRPLERPAENGCELVVHTPWAYHDVYAHKLKKWPGEYKVHVRHILEDKHGNPDHITGTSIFPSKLSTDKAKQLLKTDYFVNMAQYMCIPRAGRDMAFTDEWMKYGEMIWNSQPAFRIEDNYYNPEICDPESGDKIAPQLVPLYYMSRCIILDPTPSKDNEIKAEPRANNGIVVVGKDPWGRRYCLESVAVREGPTELLHRLIALGDKWGTLRIGIEEVNFSAVYAPLWQALIRHEYPDLQVEFFPLNPKLTHFVKGLGKQQKNERIRQELIKTFENGYWFMNRATTGRLVQELLEFPHGETKDLPDALSYTDRSLQRPESPQELEVRETAHRGVGRQLGPTGYGSFF